MGALSALIIDETTEAVSTPLAKPENVILLLEDVDAVEAVEVVEVVEDTVDMVLTSLAWVIFPFHWLD